MDDQAKAGQLLSQPVSPYNKTDYLIRKTFEQTIAQYWTGPEGWLRFMWDELRYRPDKAIIDGQDCIERVVIDVADRHDTAAVTCHGTGKTTMGATCLLTAMCMVPELLVMQLSPTWSQVTGIFWNEIRKWHKNSRICDVLFELADKAPYMTSRIAPEIWYSKGMASNMPGRVEGRHNRRVFQIIDENKAVPDDIVEAVEGAMTSEVAWRLRLSTPSTPGGKYTSFYKCFTRSRENWRCHKITADQSPRVSRSWVERMIFEYGKDSQIVRARVYAEFPEAAGNILIPLQAAEQFYQEDLEPSGPVSIGVDVARFGGDESIATVWRGLTMIAVYVMKESAHKTRLTELAKQVKERAIHHGAQVVVIDDIGVGGGVTDLLADMDPGNPYGVGKNITVVAFTSNATANQETKYRSIGDEIVWEFAAAIKNREAQSSVEDEKLIYQLSSYTYQYTAKEQIVVNWPEKKGERAADEPSPDRADACWLGWYGARLLLAAGIIGTEVQRKKKTEEELDLTPPEFRGIRDKDF